MIERGQRFGAYSAEAVIGEGGMGIVVRGRHVESGTLVALKILTPDRRAEEPGLVDRLRREASVLQALAHIPYVVGYHEQFRLPDDGADVLVLEYIEGRSLETLLGGAALPIDQVLEWMGHTCHALHDMHEAGFVHRDLKPDNLMLVGDPTLPLRLIDFNSAGSSSAAQGKLTRAQGAFPYTPAYLAPECFDGLPADKSADVYALGITFAELLLGHHPLHTGDHDLTNSAWRTVHDEVPFPDLRASRPEIPAALNQIFADATAKRRRDRIPDAVALWSRLKAVWDELQEAPSTPGPAPAAPVVIPPPTAPAPAGGRRWIALAAGALGLVGLLTVVGVVTLPGWIEASRLKAELAQRDQDEAVAAALAIEQKRAAMQAEHDRQAQAQRDAQAAREREAAELLAKQAQRQQEIQRRAEALGVAPTPARIDDPAVLDKALHSKRWGSHWIYETHGFGTATIEDLDGVLFFTAENKGGASSATLEGIITVVDSRGVTVEGRLSVSYRNHDGTWDPPCGFKGNHRFGLAGHPWKFRGNADCPVGWHYLDWLVDDDWLDAHPADKRPAD